MVLQRIRRPPTSTLSPRDAATADAVQADAPTSSIEAGQAESGVSTIEAGQAEEAGAASVEAGAEDVGTAADSVPVDATEG